jgi:hypothetical protein
VLVERIREALDKPESALDTLYVARNRGRIDIVAF